MQIKAVEQPVSSLASYGQIVLFGDSITEGAWNVEWFSHGAALAHDYNRRLDVMNRGFGGYTTRQALELLPRIFPTKTDDLKLVLLFFGANDAVLPGFVQHVPLKEYIANIRQLVESPQLAGKVIVLTPPPVDEYTTGEERKAEATRQYAEALQSWCTDNKIPCADVWRAYMDQLDWKAGQPLPGSLANPQNTMLTSFFRDGLHPVSAGYLIIYDTVKAAIEQHFPELSPDNVEPQVPHW
ncbi:GDSL Lipase/Acylhydrolase family protein, partial [Protomyces lactucae-debilis]